MVDSGLTDTVVTSLAVSGGEAIFAGTGSGVFLSNDNGTSWTAVNTGLGATNVQSFAVSGDNIFAGTSNNGVWRRPLSEMIGPANAHPQRKIINQVLFKINPLIRSGSIIAVEFAIPHSELVAVTIFDLTGREISSIVNKQLNAGSYQYFWDAHTFARGCYAVRLQAGATTRMKLVRIAH